MITDRSSEKELIDLGQSFYTQDEYNDCLKKLFDVSRFFLTFYRTIKILKKFSPLSTVLDVGCGGGLFLWHLNKIFPNMYMIGIDTNANAIDQAKKLPQNNQLHYKLESNPELQIEENSIDIIIATYLCHHLDDNALIEFLKKAHLACKKIIILNDLDRKLLSQFLFRIISPILFRNRLITHDGLISIRRGFTRKEWHRLLAHAGIKKYQIKWRFPFHWQVIIYK